MQSFKMPIVISVILHLIIFALLFVKLAPSQTKTNQNQVQVVQATAISQNQIQHVTENTKVIAPKPASFPADQIRHLEQIALKQPETPKIPVTKPIEKPPVPEEAVKPPAPIAMQEPKLSDLQKEITQKAVQAKKEQAEKQKAARQQKEEQLATNQREAESKQLQQELAAAKKEKTEVIEKAPQNNESDEEKEADSDAKSAQSDTTTTASADNSGEIDKYKQRIIDTISRKWLMPDIENQELACQLMVHLGPGGVVVSVDILKESGDANLDRSARNAIMKASPLPVPENGELFDNFRSLRLTFRPQGIISS